MKELGAGSRFESQIIWDKPKRIAIDSNVIIKRRCRLEAINTARHSLNQNTRNPHCIKAFRKNLRETQKFSGLVVQGKRPERFT